jgi:hypothetical protein
MTTLYPTDIPEFLRKYRFANARVRRFRVASAASGETTIDVVLIARKAMADLNRPAERVVISLTFRGVEEYRFQKRPGGDGRLKTDCRFGTFEGLVYVDFDAYPMGRGDVPKLHDFRASDLFAGCRDLRYTVREKARTTV